MPSRQLSNPLLVSSLSMVWQLLPSYNLSPDFASGALGDLYDLSSFANYQGRVGMNGRLVRTFSWNRVSAKREDMV